MVLRLLSRTWNIDAIAFYNVDLKIFANFAKILFSFLNDKD